MKKIIFLLLLAQTISFLYADSGCIGYTKYQGAEGTVASSSTDWRWGSKAPQHQQCYCNCAQYTKGNYKCPGCGHKGIPEDMKLTIESTSNIVSPTFTVKKINHKKESSAQKKEKAKRKADAKKQAHAQRKAKAKKKAKAQHKAQAKRNITV